MALELKDVLIVFQDDNVYEHPHSASTDVIPEGSWALSGNSVDRTGQPLQPCEALVIAAKKKITWIVHAAHPSVPSLNVYDWKEDLYAHTYVIEHFSLNEMMALGFVLHKNFLFTDSKLLPQKCTACQSC